MSNIACRIFKEQLDVVLCLPEDQQGKAIITILKNAFQIEHNTELSPLTQSVVNLLSKTIACKEFSPNYGGKRRNSGRKPASAKQSKILNENQFDNQIENQNEKQIETINADEPNLDSIPKDSEIIASWNAIADRFGRPKIENMTPTRRTRLRARAKSCKGGVSEFFVICATALKTSAFLRGERDWSGADFDFFLQESRFQKAREGAYNENGKNNAAKVIFTAKDLKEAQKEAEIQKILNGER